MSVLSDLKAWFEQSLDPVLPLRPFTALLGVRPARHAALERLLAQLDAEQNPGYTHVLGLHGMRWIVLAPGEKGEAQSPSAARALVLSVAFDGELEDILEGLMERVGHEIRNVLRHCEGFIEQGDPIAYLKRHEVHTNYFFRDLGPFAPGATRERIADASILEIQSAFASLDQFAAFYAKHPPAEFDADPARLVDAFRRTFDELPAGQRRLAPYEERRPEEDRWARLASELMVRKQERVRRHSNGGPMLRSAHAKGHGLVHARFKLCDVERQYRVGVFGSRVRELDAVLRPSNAADAPARDRKPDARGLAISLDLSNVSVPGAEWLGVPHRQDFLLFNDPVFIAPDIERFVRFLGILEARSWRRKLWHVARYLRAPGGARQLWITMRCSLRRPRHPLQPEFHSTTPYKLGDGHVVKYSVRVAEPSELSSPPGQRSEDVLGMALEGTLARRISLDFYGHVLPATGARTQTLKRAIEDATLDWSTLGATRVKLATIEIGPQPEDVATRMQNAERWEFSPWNALEAHRPLGSINRARRLAYRVGAALRRAPAEVTSLNARGRSASPSASDAAVPNESEAAE